MLKKSIITFLAAVALLFLPLFVFADPAISQNGTVTAVAKDKTLTVSVEVATTSGTTAYTYKVKPTSGTYAVGQRIHFSTVGGKPVASTVGNAWTTTSSVGAGSTQAATTAIGTNTPTFSTRLFDTLSCPSDQAIQCWVQKVFQFSQYAIIVLATGAIVIAGVIYMSSAGNPKLIAQSKKLIIGALSGVAVMVLGRFFLNVVLGLNVPF